MTERKENLPGADLIAKGLGDLALGIESVAGLLVLIGAPRLKRLGVSIPVKTAVPASPEHALYRALRNENPADAHSRYNALIRRLVSYERSLEKYRRR